MEITRFVQKLVVTAIAAGLTLTLAAQTRAAYKVGPISVISQGCGGSNAEVEQATDVAHGSYVYEAWIGCGGIGFARSTNGGKTFSAPQTLPVPRAHGTRRLPSLQMGLCMSGSTPRMESNSFRSCWHPSITAKRFPRVRLFCRQTITTGAIACFSRPDPMERSTRRGITVRKYRRSSAYARP